MHGIIFVSMSADIPSFETDVLLDTPDASLATESAIRGVRRQFEDLSDRLWSSGEIQAVREELDGVEFTAWKQYGTPEVANTDSTGTTPDGSTVFLRDIDMTDFGVSFTDCCYLLEMFVRDAAIRHSFNNRVANDATSGYWTSTSQFITFAAAP